jgi:hypothetical protein
MDIQQLQNSLTGLQQPQQQFFNPQQQPQQAGQIAQPQAVPQITMEGNILRIPLLMVIVGLNVKCFIEHKLQTGTLQEAQSVLQWYFNAGWPIDGWQPRQEQGQQYQQQGQYNNGQQYGQQYQQRQYNNGYNRGGYRSNYRRY